MNPELHWTRRDVYTYDLAERPYGWIIIRRCERGAYLIHIDGWTGKGWSRLLVESGPRYYPLKHEAQAELETLRALAALGQLDPDVI